MELFDTHAHFTFPDLEGDVDAVIARSIDAGVTSWITVATEPGELQRTLDLAARFDNMYVALGYHPHHAKDVGEEELALLEQLAELDEVVAVGETGLDYHYTLSEKDLQQQIFRAQLNIAAELTKPVVVHTRNAFDESMEILDEFEGKLKDIVIHCYSGTIEQTQLVLDRGYHVSFTGIVTFKNASEARDAAKMVPLDPLMLETDCPYISPEPVRNQRPNESALMIHTAKKIAEVRGMALEDFAKAVTDTSKRFFGI